MRSTVIVLASALALSPLPAGAVNGYGNGGADPSGTSDTSSGGSSQADRAADPAEAGRRDAWTDRGLDPALAGDPDYAGAYGGVMGLRDKWGDPSQQDPAAGEVGGPWSMDQGVAACAASVPGLIGPPDRLQALQRRFVCRDATPPPA